MKTDNEVIRYFRNHLAINDIEPDSLWKLNGEMLELVDDDQYVAILLRENDFYEIFDQLTP
ncbi:MAG: hypothetical protein ACOYN4_10030 [Bacteroidales bacterium]